MNKCSYVNIKEMSGKGKYYEINCCIFNTGCILGSFLHFISTVNFMMLKMIVEFEDGQDPKAVMKDVLKNCKKVEDDCEIYL